jgi:hypothetical protein
MRRYLMLFVGTVAVGLVLVAVGRRIPIAPSAGGSTPRGPVVEVAITITPDSHIEPDAISVPKDARVRLSVTNHHRLAVSLALMGYQDRFGIASVAPDSTWHGEFVADRPGDDFAWVLEGAPVGRLRVTGSHLVEGHR